MAVYSQAAVAIDTEDPKVSRTHFLLLLLLSFFFVFFFFIPFFEHDKQLLIT